MKKILVTPRSFAKIDETPMEMLEKAGIEVIQNPYGRILKKDEMLDLTKDVDGIIVGVDPLDKEVIDNAPNLKIISKYGVGLDNIDVAYAKEKGINTTVTIGANTNAVAEYTIALMLSVARKVASIDRHCRQRDWSKMTTIDMNNKTLGLIGMGQIGKTVAKRLSGFEMKILAYDLYPDKEFGAKYDVTYTQSITDILKEADFISLHLPLTKQTKNIINQESFTLMKKEAVIVNTARGGLIDEEALYNALIQGQIWGAGIDVFEEEPPTNDKLLTLDNIVLGSHCAASTKQAVMNMGEMSAQNIITYLNE